MEEITSFLLEEFVAVPLVIIMVAGFLVVPFATPAVSLFYIVSAIRGKISLAKAPLSFLVMLYGLVFIPGVWVLNPDLKFIHQIVDTPLLTLALPALVMCIAIREQMQLEKSESCGVLAYIGLALSSLCLYWMAFSAVMAATV